MSHQWTYCWMMMGCPFNPKPVRVEYPYVLYRVGGIYYFFRFSKMDTLLPIRYIFMCSIPKNRQCVQIFFLKNHSTLLCIYHSTLLCIYPPGQISLSFIKSWLEKPTDIGETYIHERWCIYYICTSYSYTHNIVK